MSPFFEIGQLVTLLFFLCFVVFFPLIGLIEKVIYHLYIEYTIPIATHVYIKKNLIECKIFFNLYKETIVLKFKLILLFYLYFLTTFCHIYKFKTLKLFLFQLCQNI